MTRDGQNQTSSERHSGAATVAIAHNAFYLVAGQATTTVLAIILSAALGRYLGANDFGIYYLVTTVSMFAFVFVEWGQPILVVRAVARDPLRSGELLGTALAIRVVAVFVVAVVAAVIGSAQGYGARTTWLSVFLILATLPLSLAQGYGMVFRAREQMGRDATVTISNKAIALCATLPALAFGLGVPGVILAQALGGLVALGVANWLHGRLGASPLRVTSATARSLFVAGTPILAMTAAGYAQPFLDAIVLSRLVPPTVVGWFGAGRNIINTLLAPAAILATAAYPRIARASGDVATLRQEVRIALRPLLWLGALAGAGTYLFAGAVISAIYGSRGFEPAAQVLQVFAPGIFLVFINILLGNVIYASGSMKVYVYTKIASVGVSTLLDILLIPLFQERLGNGGIGVVVAFALSELVVFAGAIIDLPRGTLGLAAVLDVVRALGAAGATILLFHLVPPVPPWVGIPLCIAAFGAASFAVGLARRRDLVLLQVLLRRQPVE